MNKKKNNNIQNEMITKLRIRFVAIALLVLIVMQSIIVSVSVLYSYKRMVRRADVLIDSVYTNITNNSEDNNVDARYYYVIDSNDSSMPQVNNINDRIVKPKEAVKLYRTISDINKNSGFYNGYRYRIIKEDSRNIGIFIQRIGMIDEVKKNAYTLGTISVVGIGVIFIFLIAISKYMVMPIANAYKKQKEFITSASHELKTPITVILADADIIEMDGGDNEWLKDIRTQAVKLRDMTNSLVTLARMDERGSEISKIEFPISDIANEVVHEYAALEADSDKAFTYDVAQNLSMTGNVNEIRQLMTILLDNAFKYSPDNGKIYFYLNKSAGHIRMSVENEVDYIEPGLTDKMFERFYRADSTSSKVTGHGLGLAIAKNIVDNSRGKIDARVIDEHSIEINIVL